MKVVLCHECHDPVVASALADHTFMCQCSGKQVCCIVHQGCRHLHFLNGLEDEPGMFTLAATHNIIFLPQKKNDSLQLNMVSPFWAEFVRGCVAYFHLLWLCSYKCWGI